MNEVIKAEATLEAIEQYKKDMKSAQKEVTENLVDKMLKAEGAGHCPRYKEGEDGKAFPDLNYKYGFKGELSPIDHAAGLQRIFAVDREDAVNLMTSLQINATGAHQGSIDLEAINGALALVDSIGATDPIEAMIISQMVATYQASMKMTGRMQRAETIEATELYSKMADKTNKAFNQQVRALDKHRNQGKQTVVVKHVNVESGGQAIVGDINALSKGGRG